MRAFGNLHSSWPYNVKKDVSPGLIFFSGLIWPYNYSEMLYCALTCWVGVINKYLFGAWSYSDLDTLVDKLICLYTLNSLKLIRGMFQVGAGRHLSCVSSLGMILTSYGMYFSRRRICWWLNGRCFMLRTWDFQIQNVFLR